MNVWLESPVDNEGTKFEGYVSLSNTVHPSFAEVVWCMEDQLRSPECEENAHRLMYSYYILQNIPLEVLKQLYDNKLTHTALREYL